MSSTRMARGDSTDPLLGGHTSPTSSSSSPTSSPWSPPPPPSTPGSATPYFKKGSPKPTSLLTRRRLYLFLPILSTTFLFILITQTSLRQHANTFYEQTTTTASGYWRAYDANDAASSMKQGGRGSRRVLNTQEPVAWNEEELALKQWQWNIPEVDSTLQDRLDELTTDERATREWIRKLRINTQRGTGIGLGADDPPRLIQSGEEGSSWMKGWSKSDLQYYGGDFAKFAMLLEEGETGQAYGTCPKFDWEDEYAALHEEIMTGRKETRMLEYSCTAGNVCGGLADRMIGMTTTFLFAVLTKRAFTLGWEHPIPPDLVFDSPRIDWSHRFRPNSTAPRALYDTASLAKVEVDSHNMDGKSMDGFWSTFHQEYDDKPWVAFEALNRGALFRAYKYYDYPQPELNRMGLKSESIYRCLMNYIVRPKPSSLEFIHRYTSYFSLPSVFTIGLQIRTGDRAMKDEAADIETNTMDYHSQYFSCAREVAEAYSKPGQRVVFYLITDSNALRNEALRNFPGTVVTGLKPTHGEHGGSFGVKKEYKQMMQLGDRLYDPEQADADLHDMYNTVAESWIFASTDFQILTSRSGFGKIPTWMRGRRGTTINIPRTELDEKGRKVRQPKMDCALEVALSTFTSIANEWSLG